MADTKYVNSVALKNTLVGLLGKNDARYLLKGQEAASAAKVKNALTINNIAFDGSSAKTLSLAEKSHTHASTEISDFAVAVKNVIKDAGGTSHMHANKDVLDLITNGKLTAWDAKIGTADVAKLLYTNAGMTSVANVKQALDVLVANVQIGTAQITDATNNLNALNSKLSQEIKDRTSAVAGVQGSLDAEIERAKAAEGANATAITKEAETARAAEKANATEITGLKSRMGEAESKITTLNGADTVDGSVKKQIKDAVNTITNTTNGLDSRLDSAETQIAANKDAITLLNNTSEVKGSVDYKIATEIGKVNAASSALTGRVTAAEEKLTTLTGAESVDGSLAKALKDAKAYADSKVAGIVNSAPEALDTLNELAKALGNDANFSTTVTTEIGKKADKTTVEALTGRVDTAEKDISGLKTSVAAKAEQSALNAEISRAKAAEKTNADAITKLNGDKTVTGSVDQKIDAAKTTLSGNVTAVANRVTSLETKVGAAAVGETAATGLFKDIADLKAKDAAQDSLISGAKTQADKGVADAAAVSGKLDTEVSRAKAAEGTLDGKITTAQNKANANAADIAELQSTVAGHTGSIGEINTNISNIEGDITAMQGQLASIGTPITDAEINAMLDEVFATV